MGNLNDKLTSYSQGNNPSEKLAGYDSGNNPSLTRPQSSQASNIKYKIQKCQLCKDEFKVGQLREARLCPNCENVKYEIKAVLGDTSYTKATPEHIRRIAKRVITGGGNGRTLRRGPFFDPKNPDKVISKKPYR